MTVSTIRYMMEGEVRAYVSDHTPASSSSQHDPYPRRSWDENTTLSSSSNSGKAATDCKASQQNTASALAAYGNPAFSSAAVNLKTAEAAVKIVQAKLALAEAEAEAALAAIKVAQETATAPPSNKLG